MSNTWKKHLTAICYREEEIAIPFYIVRTDKSVIYRENYHNDANAIMFFIQNYEDWSAKTESDFSDYGARLLIQEVTFTFQVGEAEYDFALASDIDRISYISNMSEMIVVHNTKKMTSKVKILSYSLLVPMRSIRLTLTGIHTTAAIGETKVKVSVINNQNQAFSSELSFVKQRVLPEIKAFWPNKGAIRKGESVYLQYDVLYADMLELDDGEKTIPLSIDKKTYKVVPKKTTMYSLIANQVVRKSFPVMVGDLYLNYFKVEGDRVIWSVYCAIEVRINNVEGLHPEGYLDMSTLSLPTIVTLEAKGEGSSFVSRLYIGTEGRRNSILHFQKTLLHIGTHRIIQVVWKTIALENVSLMYKDRERFEIFPIYAMDESFENTYKAWEQIVPGVFIDITMEATYDSEKEPFYITL